MASFLEKSSGLSQLDPIDLGILRLLQQDSKSTIKEMAAELGLTVTPVYERIRRLERDGYIEGYVALLSREKIDLSLIAYCNVSIKEHATHYIKLFEREVLSLSEVMECYHVGGGFDYLLKIVVRDMDAYQHFISDKLAALENIGRVQSSFVMKEIKHSTAYPL